MTNNSLEIPRFRIEGGIAVINDPNREKIRAMVSNIYGIQKLRIQCGNRMVASYLELGKKSRERVQKAKELEEVKDRQESTENYDISAEEAIGDDAHDTSDTAGSSTIDTKKIKQIMAEYNRITEYINSQIMNRRSIRNSDIEKAITALRDAKSESENDAFTDLKSKKLPSIEMIGEVYDYFIADQYQKLLDLEKSAVKALDNEVRKHPLWDKFFSDVRGCGPMMAAVCIAYFDPYRARTISSFYKYAGLDVVLTPDGKAEGRSKRHTEKQVYYDKENNKQEKIGLTYNPKLKSKLIKVLGGGFLKACRETKDGPIVGYAKVYYEYKHRLENSTRANELTPNHIHNMAVRYMVKRFVADLWTAWRELEGLEIRVPYEVEYLGHKPHGYNSAIINNA